MAAFPSAPAGGRPEGKSEIPKRAKLGRAVHAAAGKKSPEASNSTQIVL